jgi:alcohol dehydrogenase
VGGGSAHDCAKVIALVAANGGEVRDFEGTDRSAHRGLPLICVNTTAGSGADVSRYAVITDPSRGLKMIIVDRHLMPRVAINDPLLTVGMPAAVTMASGLDALTHAIEAYVSTLASELSSLCALRAASWSSRT